LTDGLKEVLAYGETGHDGTRNLPSVNEPLSLFRLEIGENFLSFGKKSHIPRDCMGKERISVRLSLQFKGTSDNFGASVGRQAFRNNIFDPSYQIILTRISLDLDTLESELLE
jgi:hypothetical protein